MSLMWFFDDKPEEYDDFRQYAQPLEEEHLKLRVALRDVQAALRADPKNDDLKARKTELANNLAELNRQAPWIMDDQLKEFTLYGVPH